MLVGDHKRPSLEEIKRKQYYKWHNSWGYAPNSCMILKNQVQ